MLPSCSSSQQLSEQVDDADEPSSPRIPSDMNDIRAADCRVLPSLCGQRVLLAGRQQHGAHMVCVLVHLLSHVCVRVCVCWVAG